MAPVSTIRSEQEAIDLVNGWPYGLLSAVFTRDLGTWAALRRGGARRLGQRERRHELLGVAPAVRRTRGSHSGVGRVGGRFSMERLTELKTVVLNLG